MIDRCAAAPGAVARWAEHSLPAEEHTEQRVQVYAHHRIASDQDAVTSPVEAEVTGRVTGSVDGLPARQPGDTGFRIERLHHRGEVGAGGYSRPGFGR